MTKKSLILFTRYPEVGKTKTRLIPSIGPKNSAHLQKFMTEKTLHTIEQLKTVIDIEIAIYFQGGNQELMKEWLGNNYNFYPQVEGDLGIKIYSAFEDSFKRGNEQIIIIGVDCLELNVAILQTSFNALNNYDLVIGEALDGGYYLLGFKDLKKSLFENINWGSDQVFSQTISAINKLNLTTYYLPILRDIDRPEDLPYILSFFYHNSRPVN